MNLYLEKTFTPDRLKTEMEDPANTFLLAVHGDVVAGYAKLREQQNPPELKGEVAIEIERIYVRKEYLGKKVGALLMEKCLTLAQEKAYKLVWLGVWEHNAKAMAFYEKWGFEKFGSHPFLLGTDLQTDLLMKKKLN
jgi:ribosomal protein S18 acetylase RimI-like enzyme